MKYGLTLFLFVLALSGFSQSDRADSMIVCQKGNLNVRYPASWQIDTSGLLGTELFIFSPLENENDKFRENVNVLIQELADRDIDMAKYKQITEQQPQAEKNRYSCTCCHYHAQRTGVAE